MRLRIATLNILGTADRWSERRPLVHAAIGKERPDILALQEVDFAAGQAEELLEGWRVFRGDEAEPGFGNALVVRDLQPDGADPSWERVELGEGRCLVTALLAMPGGGTLRAGSVHLHWQPDEPQVRARQVARMLDWIVRAAPADRVVIAGDFNATPDEPAVAAMGGAGFLSAYAAVHGREPAWTYPSPVTPDDVAIRPPSCLDYLWVGGSARVADAWTAFDEPSAANGQLYPSDHRGLVAELEIGPDAD